MEEELNTKQENKVEEEKHFEESLVEFDCLEETISEEPSKPQLRRPERVRRPPDYYGAWTTIAKLELKEPETAEEALSGPDKAKWLEAMRQKINSLKEHKVWDLVQLPKDRRAVGSKWVFKTN